jgi:hypothetical protein
LTPASGKVALALPAETVPEVTVPMRVAPFLTLKVTVPSPTGLPLAGVTEAFSVTLESP